MKTFKIVTGILLILSGGLTFLIFDRYSGTLIPYPKICAYTGFAFIIAGGFLVKTALSAFIKKADQRKKENLDAFKQRAHKITVDLDECEIKTNNYTEEREQVKSQDAKFYDAVYDSRRNVETVNVNQAVLIYETTESGKKERYFSQPVYKDETTLKLLLYRQKQTYIYVDTNNRNQYYFDLEFLND